MRHVIVVTLLATQDELQEPRLGAYFPFWWSFFPPRMLWHQVPMVEQLRRTLSVSADIKLLMRVESTTRNQVLHAKIGCLAALKRYRNIGRTVMWGLPYRLDGMPPFCPLPTYQCVARWQAMIASWSPMN